MSIRERIEKVPLPEKYAPSSSLIEWTYHKTPDNIHPDDNEQQMVWLMNRARANPENEGVWLATSQDPRVADGRNYFNVDINILQSEFVAYSEKPPAAFDVRLFDAAKAHCEDLIARDSQDHIGQFDEIEASGFSYSRARGNVFSYADDGLNAHAAFNIDWGAGTADGMQTGRGHRQTIMSIDGDYTNVGIAGISETDPATSVGPEVVTGNFCYANPYEPHHYNRFIVGTVWEDLNDNDLYDPGEGKAGVTVMPNRGQYYAVTANSGGYAFPATDTGIYQINFSGNAIASRVIFVEVNDISVLVDYPVSEALPDDWDNDGVLNETDNCPNNANPDQTDMDGDRIGDACDSVSNIAGDINGDWAVNLTDLVIAFQICAGIDIILPANLAADVNGDGKIGIEEAVYLLRNIADLEAPSEGVIKSAAFYDTDPSYSTSGMAAMIAGFSEFTIDFYHALANDSSKAGQNLFFSTYSIENALAMTWAGAQNQTAVQMASTLHLNLPQNSFHPTLNALNIDINSRDDETPFSGDAFALNRVNALWSRIGYPFLPDYLDVIATNYDAGVRTLDFAGNPEASRQVINQWVEDQTQDKIKDLLPFGSITPFTAVVLTNAIYFKGSWYQKFDEGLTIPGPFTRKDNSVVIAELMHQQLDTKYTHGDGFDAVELPYVSPRFSEYEYPQELSMLVIIPHTGEFETVESRLDKVWMDAVNASLEMGTVNLTLPRFEFSCDVKCKDVLQELGMIDPFDSSTADFSGMVSPMDSNPWIDEVYHKAFVAVDEEGTEAAAATAVVMTDTAMPKIVTISADKPFVFLIQDQITHTILFMGRVLDPRF